LGGSSQTDSTHASAYWQLHYFIYNTTIILFMQYKINNPLIKIKRPAAIHFTKIKKPPRSDIERGGNNTAFIS